MALTASPWPSATAMSAYCGKTTKALSGTLSNSTFPIGDIETEYEPPSFVPVFPPSVDVFPASEVPVVVFPSADFEPLSLQPASKPPTTSAPPPRR